MEFRLAKFVVLGLALGVAGCTKDKDDDNNDNPTSTTSPSSWLVGDEGEMFRLGLTGDVQTYPLDEDADLLAITCVGEATAWVAGSEGTLLVSRDAGATWREVETPTSADLVAVAASETGEGLEQVYVAGHDGVVLHSPDGGRAWDLLSAPEIDFTGVATDEDGAVVLVTAMDGSIWRGHDGELQQVFAAQGEVLRGVSVTPDGLNAVAVGDLGVLVVSEDSGQTWQPLALPTARDLYAARVASDGDLIVAVGEAGTVVKIDGAGVDVQELLDPALNLRALHLRAPGVGQAVGDAGTVFITENVIDWEPIEIGTQVPLRGVDDFHVGPHL